MTFGEFSKLSDFNNIGETREIFKRLNQHRKKLIFHLSY